MRFGSFHKSTGKETGKMHLCAMHASMVSCLTCTKVLTVSNVRASRFARIFLKNDVRLPRITDYLVTLHSSLDQNVAGLMTGQKTTVVLKI